MDDSGVIRRRRDRFLVRAPPERTFDILTDPSRFPEFNPLVRVPQPSGRVERVGNVYHQVLTLGPIRVATRWETVAVDPPSLAERPLPQPPWTTVEVGRITVFGTWRSTSRYEPAKVGTLITHDLEYTVPDGRAGRVLDVLVMSPLLTVGFGVLLRRLRRWVEAAAG